MLLKVQAPIMLVGASICSHTIRTGAATLAEIELPHRKQEPYRYADLESLFRHR
jgi:hypothetical protein